MAAQLIDTFVEGNHYLLHPQKLASIQETIKPDVIVPITLLSTEEIFDQELEAILKRFADEDDVFVPSFGHILVEKTPVNETNANARNGDQSHYHLDSVGSNSLDLTHLPSGPYILHGPDLFQAWRLYEDVLGAFTFGTIPTLLDHDSDYLALDSIFTPEWLQQVGVPSRLYTGLLIKDKLLSGLRVAVTDSIDLAGVKTTLSSAAFTNVTEPSTGTGHLSQRLVHLGATLIGKTRTSPLLAGTDWSDVSQPLNPRTDGQTGGASLSAGAGPALAGYEWFDVAITQSSFNNMLDTASLTGVFTWRPSYSLRSLDAVTTLSKSFDSLDVAARSIAHIHQVASALLDTFLSQGQAVSPASTPSRLFVLEDLVSSPAEDHALLQDFIHAMEVAVGSKAQLVNLEQLWASEAPREAHGTTLRDFVATTMLKRACFEYFRGFEQFRQRYQEEFQQTPAVETMTAHLWSIGSNITDQEYADTERRLEIFKAWFFDKAMPSDAALVLPCYTNQTEQQLYDLEHVRLGPDQLPALLGSPVVAAPFTQIPFRSNVSDELEYRSVCGAIMGRPGQDLALIDILQTAFNTANWPTQVQVGRTMFPIDDNEAEREETVLRPELR